MTSTVDEALPAHVCVDELSAAGLPAEARVALFARRGAEVTDRWKTHGGYRCRQAGPGRHLWPPGVEIHWP